MGRGKHLKHKEDRVSVGTKLPLSVWLELTEKNTDVLDNTVKYLRELIIQDLNKTK